ncbi:MAG: bifunctional DNA-formamidopyrimidine glycosylase/DNA-(apurinic or apyrimidinic site) lyase [Anderseniella sp.]
MPELPEVETVRRGLEPALVGRRAKSVRLNRPDLRFPFPAGLARIVSGARITALRRRAKYILIELDSGYTLLVHLGMTGRFTVWPPDGAARNLGEFYYLEQAGHAGDGPHDHVIVDLDDGARVVYTDPRRFGFIDLIEPGGVDHNRFLAGLGVEPLGNELHADFLGAALAGRKSPLKAALLDQRIIAGLGNIYVCEALYRAGLSPRRLSGSIVRKRGTSPRIEALVHAIRAIIAEAIEAGGSTLRDYAHTDGSAGDFQQRFEVYDREGEACRTPGCETQIKRIVQSGRSSFFCPTCQR